MPDPALIKALCLGGIEPSGPKPVQPEVLSITGAVCLLLRELQN